MPAFTFGASIHTGAQYNAWQYTAVAAATSRQRMCMTLPVAMVVLPECFSCDPSWPTHSAILFVTAIAPMHANLEIAKSEALQRSRPQQSTAQHSTAQHRVLWMIKGTLYLLQHVAPFSFICGIFVFPTHNL